MPRAISCSRASSSPSTCLPGMPRALKQLLLNHLVKWFGGFFSWFIFNTDQFTDLIFHVASGGALGRSSCAKANSMRWEQVAEGQECWAGFVPRSTAARALLHLACPELNSAFGSPGALGPNQGLQQSAEEGCCRRTIWSYDIILLEALTSQIMHQLGHLGRTG